MGWIGEHKMPLWNESRARPVWLRTTKRRHAILGIIEGVLGT